MKILEFLRKPRSTAAELREARDQLSVQEAEKVVEELEAQRRKALLDGSSEKDIEAIERQIATANRDVERTAAAIEAITVRIAEAEASEHQQEIERTHDEVVKLWYEMRDNLTAIDKAAEELARLLEVNRAQTIQFRAGNHFLVHAERADLKVWPVQSVFCSEKNLQADPNQDVSEFRLPGYWPQRHPDGPRLGRLRGLELPGRKINPRL
jgi:hypothetical protein